MQQAYVIKGSDLMVIDVAFNSKNQGSDSEVLLIQIIKQVMLANHRRSCLQFPVAEIGKGKLIDSTITIIDACPVSSSLEESHSDAIICRFCVLVRVGDLSNGIIELDGDDARRIAYEWIEWQLWNDNNFREMFIFSDNRSSDCLNPPSPMHLQKM